MRKITIAWTLLLIVIFAGLTLIGFRIKKETINTLMEEEIIKQAEKYLGLYTREFPTLGNEKKITVDELIEKGYDPKLESDCNGYVIIKNTEMGYKYHSYIKCPNYMTKNYQK